MYRKEHHIYRVQYCPQFQASTGGLVSPADKGGLLYVMEEMDGGLDAQTG